MRRVAQHKKEEIENREKALKRGKHVALSYGLLKKEDHILYNDWEEELRVDRRELEDKDLKLTK